MERNSTTDYRAFARNRRRFCNKLVRKKAKPLSKYASKAGTPKHTPAEALKNASAGTPDHTPAGKANPSPNHTPAEAPNRARTSKAGATNRTSDGEAGAPAEVPNRTSADKAGTPERAPAEASAPAKIGP